MKNVTIIDNSDYPKCFKCNGTGKICSKVNCGCKEPCMVCDVCNGTGKFKESHYYIIDEKNKIAFDSDCGG
jgi:hypothetical protein